MPIRLLVFDMDGTLVDVESSWAHVHHHFGDANPEGLRRFEANEIDDEEFVRSDVRVWWRHRPELTIGEVDAILAGVPLMPGARELFRRLRERPVRTAIISGGIDLLANRLKADLGIDVALANGLAVDPNGRLTGEGIVRVPIHAKEQVLAELQARLGIGPDETASVGNSAIDVGLFRRSRLGVAFLPEDDTVRAAADMVVTEKDLGRVYDAIAPHLDGPGPPVSRR